MDITKKSEPVDQHLSYGSDPTQEFLDETAPLIGYIVQSFNALERMLDLTIADIISEREHSVGIVVLKGMMFGKKVEFISQMLLQLEKAVGSDFPDKKELLERLDKCGFVRNKIVHAGYEGADENGYCYGDINKKLEENYFQITVEKLKEAKDYIDETVEIMDEFEDKYWGFIHDRAS